MAAQAHLSRQEMLARFNQLREPEPAREEVRLDQSTRVRTPQPDRRAEKLGQNLDATPTVQRDDKYRSVHTAKKARVTLVARRAELQSELADLHSALEKAHSAAGGAVGEGAFMSSQAMVDELGAARLRVKDVDEQIAQLDEWLARDAARKDLDEEKCVECTKCASLVPRLLALEEEAARRARQGAEAFEALQLSAQRTEAQVAERSKATAALENEMRQEAAAAAAERRMWAEEERARHEEAAAARADLAAKVPDLLGAVKELQQRVQQREEEFYALRVEYRAVADLSLQMFKTVEEDRHAVAGMAPLVREEGAVVKEASTRLKAVEECKEDLAEKLRVVEERLKVAESAQLQNLGPKIAELEGKLAAVRETEDALQKVVERNNGRLKKMETKCGGVSKWMAALSKPPEGGALDMSDGSADDGEAAATPTESPFTTQRSD